MLHRISVLWILYNIQMTEEEKPHAFCINSVCCPGTRKRGRSPQSPLFSSFSSAVFINLLELLPFIQNMPESNFQLKSSASISSTFPAPIIFLDEVQPRLFFCYRSAFSACKVLSLFWYNVYGKMFTRCLRGTTNCHMTVP